MRLTRRSLLGGFVLLGVLSACSPAASPTAAPGTASKPAEKAAPATSNEPNEPLNIRFAYGVIPSTITGLMPMKKDVMKGFDKSYKLEMRYVEASSQQIPSFAAKELDAGFLAPSSFGAAIDSANLDMKIVADLIQDGISDYFSITYAVLQDSPVKTVADLKGKVIGTSGIGTADHTGIKAMLKKNNLDDQKDTQIVQVGFANMEASLRDNKVVMASLVPPFIQRAQEKGGIRTLFQSKDAIGPSQALFTVARTDWLKENPRRVQVFFDDFYAFWQWAVDPKNRDEVLKLSGEATKQPPANFNWALTKGDYFRSPTALPDLKVLQSNFDTLFELGVNKKKLDANQYTDFSWLEKAKANYKP